MGEREMEMEPLEVGDLSEAVDKGVYSLCGIHDPAMK